MKMFDYKLDTTMLPTIWVTWASTKGGQFNKRYWLNCKTGKKTDKPQKWMYYPSEEGFTRAGWRTPGRIGIDWGNRNDNNLWTKSGAAVRFAYIKYHKNKDVLELAVVGVDTTRKEEIHPWKYLGNRYFIRRDKTIVDQHGKICNRYHLYEYHDAWNPNVLFSMLNRLVYNDHAINEAKKFIGTDSFTIGSGRCIDVQYLWHLQEWYRAKQRPAIKGIAQKMVDELASITPPETNKKVCDYFDDDSVTYHYGTVVFERLNDEWSVLRTFTSKDTESCRMYISDDGKQRYAVYSSNNGWIACNPPSHKYSYCQLLNKDEAIDKCKRIKYAMEALDGLSDCHLVNSLYVMLKMPELEQLAKIGAKEAVKSLVVETYSKAELKHWSGEYYNEKEKNILRKLGLNKSQLEYYAVKQHRAYASALQEMRAWFGKDLSHLDMDSFKKYLEGFYQIQSHCWRGLNTYADICGYQSNKFVKNLIRLGTKNNQTYGLINDTLNSFRYLDANTRPEINWYFDDYSDLVRAHDAIVALKNAQDEARRAYYRMSEMERQKKDEESRKKIDAQRKQYEYEDDVYIIRLPRDLTEITNEGIKQSICIGGYTNRHATGGTNLFFLREKSNPDNPFYAIEMNNDKRIVQIHGRCNKWLGNDPDAIPTVIRWLRKNGISCSDQILTCTAKGYSGTNTYVAMPVVD